MNDAVTHFLAMGGYARFVWPAYALALVVLAGFAIVSIRAWRRAERELASLGETRPRR